MAQNINLKTVADLLLHISKAEYEELVRAFIADTREQMLQISYKEFTKHGDEVIMHVHTIKGNAVSLGFDGLHKLSARFEEHLKSSEINKNSAIFEEYLEQVEKTLVNLKVYY